MSKWTCYLHSIWTQKHKWGFLSCICRPLMAGSGTASYFVNTGQTHTHTHTTHNTQAVFWSRSSLSRPEEATPAFSELLFHYILRIKSSKQLHSLFVLTSALWSPSAQCSCEFAVYVTKALWSVTSESLISWFP